MFLAKIKTRLTFKRSLALVALACLITMKLTGVMYAQSITSGYGTDERLQRGMVVGLVPDDATKVEALNVHELDRILGIVVDPNDSPITISGNVEKVFVATIGRYEVLVSDEEGAISPGEYITVSSLDGIAMKATFEQSEIVGRAMEGFSSKEGVIGDSTLKDSNGKDRTLNLGRIEVDIGISKNPLAKSAAVTPEWLGKIGQAISGKSLSPARLYISVGLLLIGSIIAIAILYSGIRNSMISIGRNPLSKKSILRGLLQVIFTSLIVFIISVVGVYLLLKA